MGPEGDEDPSEDRRPSEAPVRGITGTELPRPTARRRNPAGTAAGPSALSRAAGLAELEHRARVRHDALARHGVGLAPRHGEAVEVEHGAERVTDLTPDVRLRLRHRAHEDEAVVDAA